MRIKDYIYILSFIFLFVAVASCSDDDETVPFNRNVIVDVNDIELDPGAETTITITDGNGNYQVKSTNDEIATASVTSDKTVIIQAHTSGKASIIITDDKGVNAVVAILVYSELKLETDKMDIAVNSSVKVKIIEGNGDYRVTSSHPQIQAVIETDEEGAFVVINCGDTELTGETVTVFDKTEHQVALIVNVFDPYILIKNDATERIEYGDLRKEIGVDNITFYKGEITWGTFYRFGWWENNSKTLSFVLPTGTDLTKVGEIGGGQITYNLTGYGEGNQGTWKLVEKTEILKYDKNTNKVWIVFYYNGVRGVVCLNI
ncbi:MAG: hypothetical protein GX963_15175 [Bacteroidales bacterium]|mgnify:CR=1 FL=1|nr:hypothetical protein [Bacteroidales bacterium]